MALLEVNEYVVAIVIWGETDAVLDEWLPTASEFVQSIHFLTEEPT